MEFFSADWLFKSDVVENIQTTEYFWMVEMGHQRPTKRAIQLLNISWSTNDDRNNLFQSTIHAITEIEFNDD